MNVGNQLSLLRKKKGLSQEQLAIELGVSRQSVSKWETGITQPELTNIEKLCEIFEVTPNELMGYEINELRHKEPKRKNVFLFSSFVVVIGIILCFSISLFSPKEEYRHFYVNDFRMKVSEKNEEFRTYQLSFVPSIAHEEFDYEIVVVDYKGKSEIFDAYLDNSLCFSEIYLSNDEDVTIYAQIRINKVIYSCPLIEVWADREE